MAKPQSADMSSKQNAKATMDNAPSIPEHEIKQNSGVSASMALQAMQKAWDLRQAANAAGDPDAREEILAKAINKEIEAESFGKAAKYTRSGAFQGLAAGAGLGVQPGVTIGKLTGALVGGVVATVTGLLGGGIGSVYGAINGPMWDLGEMASHGVRGVIGDFPNWKSTPAQKRALEKMVMQAKDTQAPTKDELEQMKNDAPDEMSESWAQSAKAISSWRPSMPSMPSMPSLPQGAALGLGGLGASMPSWGGGGKAQAPSQAQSQPQQSSSETTNQNSVQNQGSNQAQNQQSGTEEGHSSKLQDQVPKEAPKQTPQRREPLVPPDSPASRKVDSEEAQIPEKASKPRKQLSKSPGEGETEKIQPLTGNVRNDNQSKDNSTTGQNNKYQGNPPKKTSSPATTSKSKAPNQPKKPTTNTTKNETSSAPAAKTPYKPRTPSKIQSTAPAEKTSSNGDKDEKTPATADKERRKPRKLASKTSNAESDEKPTTRRTPRKLETRRPAT